MMTPEDYITCKETIEQLCKDLAEARAEIERLKAEEQAQIDMLMSVTGGSSVCANGSRHTIIDKCLYCELAEARAEIEKWRQMYNESVARDALTIRCHAKTIDTRDRELAKRDKLIEQMREALDATDEYYLDKSYAGKAHNTPIVVKVREAQAALSAAERVGK